MVLKLENDYAYAREAKKVFENVSVYQDVNFIHVHFSTLSKTIAMLESCGALLHDSLENINRVTFY